MGREGLEVFFSSVRDDPKLLASFWGNSEAVVQFVDEHTTGRNETGEFIVQLGEETMVELNPLEVKLLSSLFGSLEFIDIG